MKFRSPTDQPLHVALTTGHTCVITPEGNEVAQMFRPEAISRGAILDSDTSEEALRGPGNGFDKKAVIAAAMKAMLDGSDKDDFTGEGKPNLLKLRARVGFNLSREEADAVWVEVSKTPETPAA